ncbi:MAG: glycosyltransferase [Armatimonadetes bacterium]|nr:glycosyltransferase [Armatimonadota bacterium]
MTNNTSLNMPRPKILFLAHLLPYPLDGGGQIKSYHTLRLLSERYDVTMLALIRRDEERENAKYLEPFCIGGVHCYLLKRNALSNVTNALVALLTNRSFLVSRDTERELAAAMCFTCYFSLPPYPVIHVDHLQMMPFVPRDMTEPIPIVLDQHNVEHRIPKRLSETPSANPLMRWYAGIEWRKLRRFELATMRRADVSLTVSDEDRDAFVALAPDLADKIVTYPIGVDTDYFAVAERAPDASDLLSIGTMYWMPNVDAATWFVSDILPLVRHAKPDARFVIVGAKPTPEIVALGQRDAGVVVTGTVPDVRPFAATCGVFIVPLRSGSGMRVKILNALSMGLPVVSTTVGAEGIGVTHGTNILLADTPRVFADAVLQVLNDRALADRLGANGRRLMEERYGWNAVGRQLFAVYDRVLGNGV